MNQDDDEFVTCTRCAKFKERICKAAGGELHHSGPGWKPNYPARPMRCYAYIPLRGEIDRRTGDERWPWLRSVFTK